ncbi:solute carrier family 2, facilitated glucose transporter member 1-like isoform X1 [Oppia nitens]|uniref:solute carrier family 2, facilitated glucose transporter member 1-like isoform X1 n=1 Tax=Oppia nitens TaxID=1686743 RepID=UPI0023DB77EC|nr:solute carrier family 2, facilitated glucose transporter member 1-like isoform X1 [Oppia nitens]
MDDLRLSEMAYLNIPDRDRDKSPSPAESMASSTTDLSTLPMNLGQRRDDSGGLNSHLVFAISAAALGSSFQHGYNTGVVNAPQELVQKFIREAHRERFQDLTPLHDIFGNTTIGGHNSTTDTIGDDDLTTVNLIYSIMVSIFCIGGMIGALLTGYVAEKFGRKGGLLWNNVFVFLAAGLMGFSKVCRSYEMLIMGRFFIGFNAGLNAGLAPMYLTEISPTNMRGAIGTIYQLVITISIFTSNLLGLPQVLGTEDKWPILFAVTIVPAIFTLATLPMCPESPKYILIFQNKDVQAQRALTWLRGTIEVHDEMDDMRAEYESMKLVPKVTLHELWYNSMLRQPLIIALVVMLSQQFSGINAVIFFSTSIFEKAGLNKSAALYATLGIGVINVLMTIVSLVLVEKSGRKTLLLTGLGGMMFTTIVLTFCLALKDTFESLSYVSILAVYVFIVMFASGPGSIPWFLVAELFGVGARAMATSIAVSVNWTANFVVGLAFLPLQETMGGYVFVIFTVLLALFWLFVYKKVPETKGKTVEEIAAAFRQKAYQ